MATHSHDFRHENPVQEYAKGKTLIIADNLSCSPLANTKRDVACCVASVGGDSCTHQQNGWNDKTTAANTELHRKTSTGKDRALPVCYELKSQPKEPLISKLTRINSISNLLPEQP